MGKIADPAYVGNDHIKQMLDNPSTYSVRRELVQHLVRSFYDIYWNRFDPLRAKLNVQVLQGDHSEGAVINVSPPDFCLKQAEIAPSIAPLQSSGSAVIINSDAVSVLRKELCLFFEQRANPRVSASEMLKRFTV